MNFSLPGSSWPWHFSGRNTGVCCHFPTPGDHPNPGTEPASPESPALAGRFFTPSTTREAHSYYIITNILKYILKNISPFEIQPINFWQVLYTIAWWYQGYQIDIFTKWLHKYCKCAQSINMLKSSHVIFTCHLTWESTSCKNIEIMGNPE